MLPQAHLPQFLVFFDILQNDWVDQAEILSEGSTLVKQAYVEFLPKLVQSS